MAYPLSLAGPGGRFDLTDPRTQSMVNSVAANPSSAPLHNVSLAEIFQLQKMLGRMSTAPMPQTSTVYDDMKNAALLAATAGQVGRPQAPQQPPPAMPPEQQGLAQLAQQPPEMPPEQPMAQTMAQGGLAQLPVNNFQPSNYAGGGIVAFDDGGRVHHFQTGGNKAIPLSELDTYEQDYGGNPVAAAEFLKFLQANVDAPAQSKKVIPASEQDTGEQDRAIDPDKAASYLDFLKNKGVGPEQETQDTFGTPAEMYKTFMADARKLREDYKVPTLEQEMEAGRVADTSAGIAGLVGDKRVQQLEALKSGEGERRADALRNFGMMTGFNMAAEASKPGRPNAGFLQSITQPLSVGAAAAAPGYLADQKEIRNLSEARDKELTDIESLRRAEAKGNVKGAQDRIQKKMEKAERLDEKILGLQERVIENRNKIDIARSAIPKPTDMIMYARSYLESARAKGDSKTPDSVLLIQGMSAFNKEKGLETLKYAGIKETAATGVGAQETAAYNNSVDQADKILSDRNPISKKFKEAGKLDKANAENNAKNGTNLPTNHADVFRNDLIRKGMQTYKDMITRQPTASAAPAATRSVAPPAEPRTTYTAANLAATMAANPRMTKAEIEAAYAAKGMVPK